jgi:nitronate monooxygenase
MSGLLQTKLCDVLGIRYPIIQAEMAGKITTPELVAAVSNHGGLGMLGAAYMSPEQIEEAILKIKELTDKPFGVNLFCFTPSADKGNVQVANQFLDPVRKQLDIPTGKDELQYVHNQAAQFDAVLEHRVPVLSFTFGIPHSQIIDQAKTLGIKTKIMVTTVKEALLAEEAGIDLLVAQGSDAGGHRGTFEVEDNQGALVGTMSLIPQIVDHTNLPVIAAGGIMDGRGLIAALALGAQGVQMGTRFLFAKEAGTHPSYRQALTEGFGDDTVVTTAFSGRPARALKNEYIKQAQAQAFSSLPYPYQNVATQDIRQAAAKQNDPRFMSLWAGQALGLKQRENPVLRNQPAAEILDEIVAEARSIIVNMQTR